MIEIPKTAKALIFDLDGTVANTMQNHFVAWRKAVLPYGIDFSANLFMQLTGMPQGATIKKLNEMFGTKMRPNEVGAIKSEYFRSGVHLTQEIDVVTNVVRKYHTILPLAIGTGSTKKGAQKTLEVLGMGHYFDFVVTADDVLNFKPHPETFLKCAKLMNVKSQDCVVFEDGILGIQAAEEAGMMVIDVNDYFKMEFTV
ncbi:HAD family phosphatase [Lutibacter sp.]|uniref:HAD family hydrolase n=1 Tax=Lutibacter sp. TaxID=1925666 RepID=UPI0027326476|nr:beta-phosphoglucomutase family hydrolase [Lutibacter sp.]MDP3313837.1 beta-phosphoglucomutase family hydrolase [Lutibacter sp.]